MSRLTTQQRFNQFMRIVRDEIPVAACERIAARYLYTSLKAANIQDVAAYARNVGVQLLIPDVLSALCVEADAVQRHIDEMELIHE